jgi:hypothetical protein
VGQWVNGPGFEGVLRDFLGFVLARGPFVVSGVFSPERAPRIPRTAPFEKSFIEVLCRQSLLAWSFRTPPPYLFPPLRPLESSTTPMEAPPPGLSRAVDWPEGVEVRILLQSGFAVFRTAMERVASENGRFSPLFPPAPLLPPLSCESHPPSPSRPRFPYTSHPSNRSSGISPSRVSPGSSSRTPAQKCPTGTR